MKNLAKRSTVHGFTLIELMITVAIVSILAAIAVPAYNGYIKTAKMSEASNNLAALRLAQEEYFLENNEYFFGTNTSSVEAASGNLWKATPGTDGINFDYVVTASSGWSATASGYVSVSPVYNETITFTK